MNPPYSVMSSLLAVMIGTLLMLSILSMMMIGVCIVHCVHCALFALCGVCIVQGGTDRRAALAGMVASAGG